MTDEQWQQRLAAIVAEVQQRKRERAEQRDELQRCRDAGLRARHARRLDRDQRSGSRGGAR